jgi:3-phosphoshikimate 1-carboxyvinyltransferase
MNLIVKRTLTLQGNVTPPSSKSQSIRAIFFSLLAHGHSILNNFLSSDDTRDALNVAKALGASVSIIGDQVIIDSPGLPIQTQVNELYSGNSGITTRFMMPMLGLRHNPDDALILNCGEQMRTRPIDSLVDALIALGLNIEYLQKPRVFPITITGQLLGGKTSISGITSQYLSALLISLPCAVQDSEITVRDLHERPYVEMTLDWLRQQNIIFSHHAVGNTDIYRIQGGQKYLPININVSGDFSSASYLIAAAVLLPGEIVLDGLNMQEPQGDKQLVTILQQMGADIRIETDRLYIRGGKTLTGMKIDANAIPDLLPTLAVIGTQAIGKTEIANVKQARIKETDRIHSMTEGLRRLGAKIDEYDDGLTVYPSQLQGAIVKGYGDHRTVMALSLAGLLADGTTIIDDAEAINKTFPRFVELMQSLGATMEVEQCIN